MTECVRDDNNLSGERKKFFLRSLIKQKCRYMQEQHLSLLTYNLNSIDVQC